MKLTSLLRDLLDSPERRMERAAYAIAEGDVGENAIGGAKACRGDFKAAKALVVETVARRSRHLDVKSGSPGEKEVIKEVTSHILD